MVESRRGLPHSISNATITLYTGISFGTAHAQCRAPVIENLPDGSHQITEQCRDTEVDGTPWTAVTPLDMR
jgi:hypothetical protein